MTPGAVAPLPQLAARRRHTRLTWCPRALFASRRVHRKITAPSGADTLLFPRCDQLTPLVGAACRIRWPVRRGASDNVEATRSRTLSRNMPPSETSGCRREFLAFRRVRHLARRRAEYIQLLVTAGTFRRLAWTVLVRLHAGGPSTDLGQSG